ncbi:hypothetical protein SO802_017599 [Lithocarpus litseifolius]|uniref:Transposase n=1 Tax=Lithocarpus litseifolius TaxID=425828 RepID=A0AAW2CIE5_9ROSI
MQLGDRGAANLRKKGCPDYAKLKQLFAPSTATGQLQISSNTLALTSDEEHAPEEKLANDGLPPILTMIVTLPTWRVYLSLRRKPELMAEPKLLANVMWKMQVPRVTMASGDEWLDTFLRYDFGDSYFNDVNVDAASGFTNKDNSDSECDSEDEVECDNEDEAEFDFVNPIVGEMFAYMQQRYDKQPIRTSVLMGNRYMEELEESNPKKCFEMFRMTRPLLLHLVDELRGHKCVGAIDGTHISARPPLNVTQFTYVHAGWEGSANDSPMLDEAISDSKHGFPWPPMGIVIPFVFK